MVEAEWKKGGTRLLGHAHALKPPPQPEEAEEGARGKGLSEG